MFCTPVSRRVLGVALVVLLAMAAVHADSNAAAAAVIKVKLTQQQCVDAGKPFLADLTTIANRLAGGCKANSPSSCCGNINGFFGDKGELFGCLCYQPIFDIVKQQVAASPKSKEVGISASGDESLKILDTCKTPYLGKFGCK